MHRQIICHTHLMLPFVDALVSLLVYDLQFEMVAVLFLQPVPLLDWFSIFEPMSAVEQKLSSHSSEFVHSFSTSSCSHQRFSVAHVTPSNAPYPSSHCCTFFCVFLLLIVTTASLLHQESLMFVCLSVCADSGFAACGTNCFA